MKILVACEYSATVRNAIAQYGHDVWSCDVLPSDDPHKHIQCDVLDVLEYGWDMMIAHPPCTYLSYAGNRWKNQPGRSEKIEEAMEFFMRLVAAPIDKIAIENPRGLPIHRYRRSDQIIQPWMFGDGATKETHLWLKNLPILLYSQIHINPVKNWTEKSRRSAKERSKTFPGIARAMALQWCSRV